MLLLPDQSDPQTLVLRVLNVETRKVEHTLARHDQCLRYLWNPDGKRIAFFCFGGKWRNLFLWNMDTGKVDQINVPRTQGAAWLEWSPDGRFLAYKSTSEMPGDPNHYILVDSQDLSVIQLPLLSTVSALTWAPDSRRFALLDSARPHSLDVIDLRGQLLHRWELPADVNASALQWAPRSERLIVTYHSESPQYMNGLGIFDLADGQLKQLTAPQESPDSITWAPDEESIYFQYDLPESRPIFQLQLSSLAVRTLEISGFNEIRGITPDSKALIVLHRSARPDAWIRFWVAEKRSEVLYQPASASLPEIPGHTVWIASYDQFPVPLLVYQSPKPLSSPAAVIACHGGGRAVRVLPTWEPGPQMLLREGVHYLAINFRGSSGYGKAFNETGDTATQTLDLLAAVEYAHNTLGVPYDRIAVFGHSDGDYLVAAAARHEPTHVGIACLVSFRYLDKSILTSPSAGSPRRVVLVHPTYDFNSLDEARALVAKAIAPEAASDAVLRVLEVDDEHQIVAAASWPAIFELLLDELKH
jgi:dipeptidyl aminopeptidase/acylaminoacyl peptidase